MYAKIDEAMYKQNIIDYIQIVFEGIYHKSKIRFEDIIRIMRNRITEKESIDIAKLVYEHLDRYEEETVSLD